MSRCASDDEFIPPPALCRYGWIDGDATDRTVHSNETFTVAEASRRIHGNGTSYSIVVGMGNGKWDGTSSDIFATIYGSRGYVGPLKLSGAFAVGKDEAFVINGTGNVGNFESLYLCVASLGSSPCFLPPPSVILSGSGPVRTD